MIGTFKHTQAFKNGFENRCVELIVNAYNSAISSSSVLTDWDENDITAQLHEYIDKSALRLKWNITSNVEQHLPKKAIPKIKGFAAKYPRIDLRFATFNSNKEYKYFLEAKNLKENDSKLKRRYIATGIDNYISKKYEYGCLIGYLLQGGLANTVAGVNALLSSDGRSSEHLNKVTSPFYAEYYESTHTGIDNIKHFIFDFT